jgi:hypothetical protein
MRETDSLSQAAAVRPLTTGQAVILKADLDLCSREYVKEHSNVVA